MVYILNSFISYFQNVSVTGVWPTLGPVSGGTILSISGRFLNVGSYVSAHLDDLECAINKTQSSSHRLVCITPRATHLLSSGIESAKDPMKIKTLTVTVDGAKRHLAMPFEYTADPVILELKPLRSPWSGGRLLTVHGTHLNAIQAPRITVLFHDRELNSSGCRVLTPSQMECPSPTVDMKAMRDLHREHRSVSIYDSQAPRTSHKVSRFVLFIIEIYI